MSVQRTAKASCQCQNSICLFEGNRETQAKPRNQQINWNIGSIGIFDAKNTTISWKQNESRAFGWVIAANISLLPNQFHVFPFRFGQLESFGQNYPEEFDGSLDCISLAVTCSFNKHGTLLAVGCNDGRIVIWDFLTRGIAKIISAHVHPVCSISWSRSGHKVGVSGCDHIDGEHKLNAFQSHSSYYRRRRTIISACGTFWMAICWGNSAFHRQCSKYNSIRGMIRDAWCVRCATRLSFLISMQHTNAYRWTEM